MPTAVRLPQHPHDLGDRGARLPYIMPRVRNFIDAGGKCLESQIGVNSILRGIFSASVPPSTTGAESYNLVYPTETCKPLDGSESVPEGVGSRSRMVGATQRLPRLMLMGCATLQPSNQAFETESDPVGSWHSLALDGNFSQGLRRHGRRSRTGRHALFRGEEFGAIVSSPIPKRTVRTAKRCHRTEG